MNQFWKMGDALVANVYLYQRYKLRKGQSARILRKFSAVRHFIFSVITSSDVSPNATLGAGLKLPHPNGIVIHDNAVIGENCMIMQQVTIGQLSEEYAPVIGSHVYDRGWRQGTWQGHDRRPCANWCKCGGAS